MALLFGAVVALLAAAEKPRIAITGDRPPFGRVDDCGEVRGLDVETAPALCAEIRAECEILLYAWERLIPGLRPGNADAIAASMSIAEKRCVLVAITAPYQPNIARFFARPGWDFDPARLAGARVGVMSAPVSADRLALAAATGVLAATGSAKLYRESDWNDVYAAADIGLASPFDRLTLSGGLRAGRRWLGGNGYSRSLGLWTRGGIRISAACRSSAPPSRPAGRRDRPRQPAFPP